LEYRTKGITINCFECGKEKYVYINTKWGMPKFCSLICWDNYRRKNKKEIITICTNCQKEIKSRPSKYKINKKKFFCGRQCQLEYHDRKLKEKLSNCKYCGKEIFAVNRNNKGQKKNVKKFCNFECWVNYKRKDKKNDFTKAVCKRCGRVNYSYSSKKNINDYICRKCKKESNI